MEKPNRYDSITKPHADTAPSLPVYQPPKSGLLSHVPASWVPYGELARIDKPIGIYIFYFPHLFGTLYVALHAMLQTSPYHTSYTQT
jgi:hypothetical protein